MHVCGSRRIAERGSVSAKVDPPVRTNSSLTRAAAVAPARTVADRWPLRTEASIVAAVTVLGAVLRFATLTSQSYWFDEAQAAHELHLSFGAMLSAWSSGEPNPPLYFLVAWPWAQVFGTGAGALRSLSAVFGTALIPLVYLCGRELISRRAGMFAAILTALNPFMIWYSQEAREYMLLTLLSAASVLFFARAWRDPSRRHLAWWAIFASLALLTQYFAGFLVGTEAALLIYRARSRASVVAAGALLVVVAALIPHLTGHVSHPAGWIDSYPLSVRIQQVPVDFAISTLYLGPAITYGLYGAAALTAALIVLLVVGERDPARLRGAGVAAILAGSVLVVPILLALLGADYYEARALIPAWIPLAVLVGGACAAEGARIGGALLAAVLCGAFVYAGAVINRSPQYQRPNWLAVSRAIGAAPTQRAIVAYDGNLASAPLAVYLPGVPWTGPGQDPQVGEAPVTVNEVDVIGSTYDTLSKLPADVRFIDRRQVDGYQVARFGLKRPWTLSPSAIGARAPTLLGPGPPNPAVLIQHRSS